MNVKMNEISVFHRNQLSVNSRQSTGIRNGHPVRHGNKVCLLGQGVDQA
jgi:hypothetical protein